MEEVERVVERRRTRIPPRWLWVFLSIGGGWASGIFLGQLSVEGVSSVTLASTIGFGVLSLVTAWGALKAR